MSLSGLVPVVLFSYLHVRYIARYFPVFLIIIFQYVETLNHSEKIKKPKNVIIAAWVIICIYSALQAGDLIKNISSINSLRLFWFPD
jgi:hypothetical protein